MKKINPIPLRNTILLVLLVALVGCSGSGKKTKSRYSVKHDYGPSKHKDMSHVPDAVPKLEPISRGGNKSPYRVLGKQYYVLGSAKGYRERGGASWYGKKFHGHHTSNGETYDMYKMTAAHKSLPIPTYVKVTNLKNGRQVIVRVNDRGPFHQGRIIDLSYAAASKLGMLASGTAYVEVEAIDPRTWKRSEQVREAGRSKPLVKQSQVMSQVKQPAATNGRYIQAGAFSSEHSAARVSNRLRSLTGQAVKQVKFEREGRQIYRVLVGPFSRTTYEIERAQKTLMENGYPDAHLVDLP